MKKMLNFVGEKKTSNGRWAHLPRNKLQNLVESTKNVYNMKRLGRCFLLWRCIFFSLQSYPLTIFLRNVMKTPVAAFLGMIALLCILTMITHTKRKRPLA